MNRNRAGGAARLACFLVSIGLSFGFISVVAAIAWASGFRLPDGVEPRDYVTLGRRAADTGFFQLVGSENYERLVDSPTGIDWAFADFLRRPVEVRAADGTARMAHSRWVSGNFFELLGVRAEAGMLATDAIHAAVVTDAFARSAYGSAVDALGKEVPGLLGTPVAVMGVADDAFRGIFDEAADIWVLDPPVSVPADGGVVHVIAGAVVPVGVLDEGVTLAAAQSMLDGFRFEPSFAGSYGSATERDRAELTPGIEFRPDARRNVLERLGWLVLVVILLLALAFMAVFDFLLAAHHRREESDAVRLAIGATPGDVFRATLVRHATWMAGTGVVGILSFLYVGDVLLGFEPFAGYLGELTVRDSVAGVGAGLVLLATAFLLSAGVVSRFVSRTSRVMSQAKGQQAAHSSRMARRALLVVAAASLLLVASLGLRYAAQARITLPFRYVDTMMVGVLGMGGAPVTAEAVRRTLVAQPEVEAVALGEMMPLLAESIRPTNRVVVRGVADLEDTVFLRNGVTPDFFETLGIAVIAGRSFDGTTASEVTVSRRAAELLAGEPGNAVGMALHLIAAPPAEAEAAGNVVTVVGVVDEVAYGSMADTDASQPTLYGLAGEIGWQQLWLVRHRGVDEDILEPFGEDAYRIGTPAEIFREQFLAAHSIEAALGASCAFALALSLVGVAVSMGRGIAAAGRHIGIYLSVGTTGMELTGRYLGGVLVDLAWATVLVSGATLLARVLLPVATAVIELWLVVPVVAVLALACAAIVHLGVARLAKRRSVSSLISGADA
ncbi:MAG: ABC transporter permease [Gammaproteobacteria bacterium]|nr:ABC transporter permease [Gammaproteobacteria bacterium]